MTDYISFTIPGKPIPMARKVIRTRSGQPRIMITMRSQVWQKQARLLVRVAYDGKGPIEGPVAAHFRFYFLPPKSWSKKKRQDALDGKIRPTSKTREGDSSNILKNAEDVLMPTVIKDDSLIVDSSQSKHYDTEERVEIEVLPL